MVIPRISVFYGSDVQQKKMVMVFKGINSSSIVSVKKLLKPFLAVEQRGRTFSDFFFS